MAFMGDARAPPMPSQGACPHLARAPSQNGEIISKTKIGPVSSVVRREGEILADPLSGTDRWVSGDSEDSY
jgi:hypothetical protein